jgi:uncharacterized protein YbjT (DUF2867 family)
MSSPVVVTGALGNIGSRVVQKLTAAGTPVRVMVRRSGDVELGPSVEIVRGSYDDPAAVRQLMEGAKKALFVTAGPQLARQDGSLALAARAAGVQHVVKISVLGGGPDDTSEIPTWHREGEKSIEATGLAWTFVRPAAFASNALRWLPTLRSLGKVFGAFGAAALPVIHPGDIADVATLALTTGGHEGCVYELTGPECLTAAEQVAILGAVVGKPFEYVNVDDDAALRGMIDAGMPKVMAEAMLHLVQSLRGAGGGRPNDTVAKLLGRPAWTFRRWVEENAAAFR